MGFQTAKVNNDRLRLFLSLIIIFCCSHVYSGDVQPPWGKRPNFTKLMLDGGDTVGEVLAIEQDKYGFIWIAGKSGLARYDGYRIKFYRNDPSQPNSISNNYVYDVLEDSYGELWVGTEGGGLLRLNRDLDNFYQYKPLKSNKDIFPSFIVRDIYEDEYHQLWVGTDNGLALYDRETDSFTTYLSNSKISGASVEDIEQIGDNEYLIATDGAGAFLWNRQSSRLKQFLPNDSPNSIGHDLVRDILKDSKGRIWVGSEAGLSLFDYSTHTFTRIAIPSIYPDREVIPIWHILEDDRGIIWLCSDGGSLFYYYPESGQLGTYVNYQNKISGLSSPIVRTIFQDKNLDFWIGNFPGGVNFHDRSNTLFETYRDFAIDSAGGTRNGVWSFAEDDNGNVWVGTNGAGLYYFDKKSGNINKERNGVDFSDMPQPQAVLSIHKDSSGIMWLGSWNQGIYKIDVNTQHVENYSSYKKGKYYFGGDNIWDIKEDDDGYLWIASMNNGIFRFNKETGESVNFKNKNIPNSLLDDTTWALEFDSQGILWVGTSKGLSSYNRKTEEFKNYAYTPEEEGGLSHFWVDFIYEDAKRNIWVATSGGGLNLFDRKTETFSHIRTASGLSDDNVVGIQEDDQGALWLTTKGGLTRYDHKNKAFRNFSRDNWLQDDAFNMGGIYKLSTGEILVGGVNGFSLFDPKKLSENTVAPRVFFTEIELFNSPVFPGVANSPLSQDIVEAKDITLTHDQSVITLKFTGLSYRVYKKNKYSYMLEGFDENWLSPTHNNSATYTNLDPGRYIFKVKASNNNGIWGKVSSINLYVTPPWWKTWWAYLLYILTLFIFVSSYLISQRVKFEREREINLRLREVDKVKDKILESTSHELRTPINGIVGLAESIKHDQTDLLSQSTKKDLDLIIASGKRLSSIVNDILDFSRFKKSELNFNCESMDLRPLLYEQIEQTLPLINQQSIVFEFDIPEFIKAVKINEDRTKQILSNLISNALKYTEKGRIIINVRSHDSWVVVSVTDTGIGIDENVVDRIFEPFLQGVDSGVRTKSGAGLGLAVTKQLVELQGGKITVASQIGMGSTFEVWFAVSALPPVNKVNVDFSTLVGRSLASADTFNEFKSTPLQLFEPDNETRNTEMFGRAVRVLVVDDETVNRMVMRHLLLAKDYDVYEAENGKQVVEAFKNGIDVDLVLLDIMMPEMSGYEVCEFIRKKFNFNELPIIFITAKTQVNDLVEGYRVGGNDFLGKPIVREELYARSEALLKQLFSHRTLEDRIEKRTKDLELTKNKLELAEMRDQLTGLYNRRYLLSRIHDDINDLLEWHNYNNLEGSRHYSRNRELIFYFVDIDNFKEVNDTYGYTSGDLILEQMASLFNSFISNEDYIIRWGGGKFLIVSPVTSIDKAQEISETIIGRFKSFNFLLGEGPQKIRKTCSIGFTRFPPCELDAQPLDWGAVVGVADVALKAAKSSGRNAWVGLAVNKSCGRECVESIASQNIDQLVEAKKCTVYSSFDSISTIQWK